MVIFLSVDIFTNSIDLRFRNGDRKIVILPRKSTMNNILLIQPMGRFTFYQHHNFGNILLSAKRNQKVKMICPPVYPVQQYVLFSTVISNMSDQKLLNLRAQNWLMFFCSKNYMHPNSDV